MDSSDDEWERFFQGFLEMENFFRLNLLDLVCLLKIIFKYFANIQAGVLVIFSLCDLVP